jgi:ubiquinone/menaquinone biosynthesis C-methylase UbiE
MARRLEFHNQRAQLRVSESSRFYHTLLRNFYKFLVPPNRSVVELGSGTGDLLAAVQPELGVGIDFSPAMVEIASKRHPELTFIESDVDSFSGGQSFDYLLMSDLVNDLPDVQRTLTRALKFAHKDSRIVLNFFNNLWRPILTLAIWLGLKAPTLLELELI